tara:strand:+ start:774 stop:1283 length:510 start_codon:yes stop_codon:yes gene_type:complete
MKKLIGILTVTSITILSLNYFLLLMPANSVLDKDIRNKGIEIYPHYDFYLKPKTLVINIKNIDQDKSTADVFRTFYLIAEEFKDREFNKVYLAYKGEKKFFITGTYFKDIGSSYSFQNPIYMLRTFPENTYSLNGNIAYSEWTGGILGVTSRQMEDLNDLANKWFIEDL